MSGGAFLDRGEAPPRAALARQLGVSRAHVTQVLRVLRLAPGEQRTVLALGDPIEGMQIGARILCTLAKLPVAERVQKTAELIRGTQHRL